MNRRIVLKLAAILLFATLSAGCVATKLPQTTVDRVARAKEIPNAPYERVLIVAIAARGASAREFEEVLAEELTNKNTYAFGYHRAASRADVQELVVRSIAEDNDVDAILFVTARLVGAEREVTKSHTDVHAQVRGGGLVDFFRYDYTEARTPPRTAYKVNVSFTTNLFDAASDERVYTVESHTDLAETTSEIIVAEGREIAKRLRKDRMVR